jgi:hypothetical protein
MEDGAEAKLAREQPLNGHSLHQEDRLHKQHQNLQERYRHVITEQHCHRLATSLRNKIYTGQDVRVRIVLTNNSVSGPSLIYTAKMDQQLGLS